jgi:aspartate-semialdehyde dehydrogenase
MIIHIKCPNGVESTDYKELSRLTRYFNKYPLTISYHARMRMRKRLGNNVIDLIKGKLEVKNVFEYYKVINQYSNRVSKICYNIPLGNGKMLSAVIGREFLICTVWIC